MDTKHMFSRSICRIECYLYREGMLLERRMEMHCYNMLVAMGGSVTKVL